MVPGSGAGRERKIPAGANAPLALLLVALPLGALVTILGVVWLLETPIADTVQGAFVTHLDAATRASLRASATPVGDGVFIFISWLGSPVAMTVLALAGAGVLARRRHWVLLVGWTEAFVGSSALALLLKHMFRRERPAGAAQFLHAMSFSFPSTHSLTSLVGAGTVAYVLLCLMPDRSAARTRVVATAVVFVLAVGLSRVYLGVHYVSDVAAGFTVGLTWLLVCIGTMHVARMQHQSAPFLDPAHP